jgi:hypothetical protein
MLLTSWEASAASEVRLFPHAFAGGISYFAFAAERGRGSGLLCDGLLCAQYWASRFEGAFRTWASTGRDLGPTYQTHGCQGVGM